MRLKMIAAALLAGAVAVAAFAPAAFAASDGSATQAPDGRVVLNHPGGGERGGLFQAIADLLNTSLEELRARLEGGESILDVAGETDQADEVGDLVTQRITDRINEAREAGRISDERAEAMLAGLAEKVDEMLNRTDFGERKHFRGFRGGCRGEHSHGEGEQNGAQDSTTDVEA